MAVCPATPAPRTRATAGSVIVLVLVFVVLLTFVVTAFLEEATSRIRYHGLFHNRDDLRVDAYSALEISLAVISQYREVEGALWGPAQGWGDPLGTVGFSPAHAGSVTVAFEDESARLPLQSLDYDSLLVLFRALGFDLPQAQALADGLLDWQDEDDLRRLSGFDGDDYRDMNPPYRPANAPVQSWDEFRLIRPFNTLFWDEEGMPTPAWQQFRSAVSLFHRGPVNVNNAPPLVLDVLQEKGVLDVRSFNAFRAGPDGVIGTEDDRLLRGATADFPMGEGGLVSSGIELLRVRVEAVRGEARFVLEGLVTWAGANPGARPAETAQQPRITVPGRPRTPAARTVAAKPGLAAELGYPFRFVRLAENRSF